MKYLQVISAKQFNMVKKGKVFTVIPNELFTEIEAKKYNIPTDALQTVEISSRKTYFFFGARFKSKLSN